MMNIKTNLYCFITLEWQTDINSRKKLYAFYLNVQNHRQDDIWRVSPGLKNHISFF